MRMPAQRPLDDYAVHGGSLFLEGNGPDSISDMMTFWLEKCAGTLLHV